MLSKQTITNMNKNVILFLILTISGIAYSQDEVQKIKKFRFSSIGFEMGRAVDRYAQLDLEMMYDLTKNPSLLDRNLTDHTIIYDRIVEGSRVGISTALVPYNKNKEAYSATQEIRIGIYYSERGTHLGYNFVDTNGGYRSVNYSTRFKELSLNGAYVFKYNPKFAQKFTLHAGPALSVGTSLFDKTSVAEHFSSGAPGEIPFSKFNSYAGKTSLFLRAYAPIGIDYAIGERFDIGVEGIAGMGVQQVLGGEMYTIPFSWSAAVRLSFFFGGGAINSDKDIE